MKRTQIHLTDEQRKRLDRRARDAGVPMAVIVREILDEALTIATADEARVAAADAAFGALDDGESWQDFLNRVRSPAVPDPAARHRARGDAAVFDALPDVDVHPDR